MKKNLDFLNLEQKEILNFVLEQEDFVIKNNNLEFIFSEIFLKNFQKVKKENIFEMKTKQKKKFEQFFINQYKKNVNSKKKSIKVVNLFLSNIQEELNSYKKILNFSKELLETYIGVDVTLFNDFECEIRIKGKTFLKYSIFDKTKKINIPLNYNYEYQAFDVRQLLEIFASYVSDKYDSFLIFTDLELYNNHPSVDIYGMANGNDGLAIINIKSHERETLITLLHECLHTLGLGHCNLWECLMNAKNDKKYSCIHLCPIDLIKLKIINPKIDIIERFYKLEKNYEEFKFRKDVKNMKIIQEIIKKI